MKAYTLIVKPVSIHYNSSIRSKFDVLQLLIGITRYILVSHMQKKLSERWIPEPDKVRLAIYVDKMSRVFISEQNKIHSFYFPFTIRVVDGQCTVWLRNECEITNASCSILEAVFYGLSEESMVEDILEHYWEVVKDFKLTPEEETKYSSIINQLLSFEPGYLRFDHDLEHKDTLEHPINHFDINYTDGGSFKLGLQSPVDDVKFIDILNTNTPCFYVFPKKNA